MKKHSIHGHHIRSLLVFLFRIFGDGRQAYLIVAVCTPRGFSDGK